MALKANWSDVLKADLGKLSELAAAHGKSNQVTLKEGERRTVTVLFLDIQGFTAMSEKLDPEDVQLIVDNCFKILTHEIEKYQGYIDKYEGDRMMALFGSRQASEQDCERALLAALEMRAKFVDINKILAERNIQIGIRIGVNTGLVVTGRIGKGRDQDFTVMGDAVNLASRLETNAPPGEILVSEEVCRSAGNSFIYESLGKIEVKGKSEPVAAFMVKGRNLNRTERWERSPFTKRSGYVGREAEHQRLMATSRELLAAKQGVRTMVIAAPAGVGKSRLVHEFMKSFGSADRGPMFVRAAAPADHSEPLGLFSDLFRRLMIDKTLFQKVDSNLHLMIHFMAGVAEADGRILALEPQALRLEMQLTISRVLESLSKSAAESGRSFLVVHFDDLQWSDHASMEALGFVGENLQSAKPILFLWTVRPEFPAPDALRKAFHIETIELSPLSENACRSILLNTLEGVELSAGDQEKLVRRSGGNPFFMEELIQSLVDDGTLLRKGEHWSLHRPIEEASLPESVNRILLSRIDRLESALKESLMAAAVAGETVPLRLLEIVGQRMGLDLGAVEGRYRTLADHGFVYWASQEGPLGQEVVFRHALTRDVVYSTLLNHNKKILHEIVGRGFEQLYSGHVAEHAALLFHHYVNAGLGTEAVKYGLLAMDQMTRTYSAKEGRGVIEKLRTLLIEGTEVSDRFQIEVELLEAENRFVDFLGERTAQKNIVEALVTRAREQPSPLLDARVALAQAMYFHGVGDFRKTREYALAGLTSLSDQKGTEKLRMDLLRNLGIACYNIGEFSAALEHYVQGLTLAQTMGDRNAEASFLNVIGLVHFRMGHSEEAVKKYSAALEIIMVIGDRRGEANATGNRGLVYWTLGEYSLALDQLKRSHEVFREIGFRKGEAVTLGNIGVIHHKLGQYEEALRCYEAALAIRREIRDQAGEGFDLVNVGAAHLQLGNLSQALMNLEAGLWVAREAGVQYLMAEALNSLSTTYRKMGERDPLFMEKSRMSAEEALRIGLEHNLVPARIKALSNLGRTLMEQGKLDRGLEMSCSSMKLVATHPTGVEGAEEEAHINHYEILKKSGKEKDASEVLQALVTLIEKRSVAIREEKFRKSFLESVPQNRFAMEEWKHGSRG